jgi:hypothetical protein
VDSLDSGIGLTINPYSHVLPDLQEGLADKLEALLRKGSQVAVIE